MAIAKEQLRQIISENDINNVGDIYALFKDSFKDMLQELLEAEIDASIGYTKNEKNSNSNNKRNGHSTKTVKSQYGEFLLIFCVIVTENASLKLYSNIKGIYQVLKKK